VRRDADVFLQVADGAELWGGQGFSSLDLQTDRDTSPAEVACSMAIVMIGGVQDSVTRILREPWPRLLTGDIALPHGRADPERVYLWYGPLEDKAVLTVRPIELREISG
jgi:hypothetical protein